ncbi:MAG: hypothetical protein ACLTDS_01290 [Bianqueaceae bacterium]
MGAPKKRKSAPEKPKEDGYPDMQAFMAAYRKAEGALWISVSTGR